MNDFTVHRSPAADGSTMVVTVNGGMTIENAPLIKESLLEALASSDVLLLDLEGVAELDLIGLQFICALHRSAQAEGKRVRLKGEFCAAIATVRDAAGFSKRGPCVAEVNSSCPWGSTT